MEQTILFSLFNKVCKPQVLGLFITIVSELKDCYLPSSHERQTNYSCLLFECWPMER